MAHFAKINPLTRKVETVIVAEQDFIDTHQDSGLWFKTSYNTIGGVHYDTETGLPSDDQTQALRYNYASIGGKYDPDADAFYEPQPHISWTLNTNTYLWEAPIAKPDGVYRWDETAYQ